MSGDLRLARLRAEGFGRLRAFEFEPALRPGSVVLAPNEAGKSTVAAAIFHGLFGFEDKNDEDSLRPWEGGPFRVALDWTIGTGTTCRVSRDFETQEVAVEWRRGGILDRRWEGVPNPRGRSSDRDAYGAELERLLGFTSPEIFRQTAFIGPGAAERPLAEELLRLLSGSERADFRTALTALESAYYDITTIDIDDRSRSAKHRPRKLEENAARRAELAALVEDARNAHAARRRAADALAGVGERIESVERERSARTGAEEAIRRRAEIGRAMARCEERLAVVRAQLERFAAWEASFRDRELELRPVAGYLKQPADFADRLTALERLDREATALRDERERLGGPPPLSGSRGAIGTRVAIVAGAMLAVAGAGLLAMGEPIAGAAATVAGLAVAGGGVWRRRVRRQRLTILAAGLEDLDARLARLDGERRTLAGSLGLDPETADPGAERRVWERARELAARVDGMRETYERLGDRPALEAERRVLESETLAVLRLERRQIEEAFPYLQSDPEFEHRFLEAGIDLDRKRSRLLEEELDRRRELAGLPAGGEDPRRLEAEIRALEEEAEGLALERDAHRLAHATLAACRRDFVEVAVRRLEGRIARVFGALTDGRYDGVEIDPASLGLVVHGVEKIGVPADRLSRGARDQLYFALRVAVLEVLASERALPIILDDPFLHFDDDRLARAGRTLARLGDSHQVLLFSHDGRLTRWGFPCAELPEPAAVTAELGAPSGG